MNELPQRPVPPKKRKAKATPVYVDRGVWKWSLSSPRGAELRKLLTARGVEPIMEPMDVGNVARDSPNELQGEAKLLRANATSATAGCYRVKDGFTIATRSWYPDGGPAGRVYSVVAAVPDFMQATESRVLLAALFRVVAFVTLRDYFLRHRGEAVMSELGFDFWDPDAFLDSWQGRLSGRP